MKLEQRIKHEAKKWKNFMIGSIVLGIFFVLPYFHDWANDFIIKLHFCNHTYCFLFSLVFFIFAYVSYDKKKSYIKSALIVLVIGIILMNLTVCDAGGKMTVYGFSLGNLGDYFTSETGDGCKPGVDCPGDIVLVPIPPCIETDDGRDYITFGTILSGADLDDLCMGNTLRERYCNSELTYTSEDINCLTMYGDTWTCEEGECRDTGEEVIVVPDKENTLALCTDELDNDGDTAIDCDDSDCEAFCEALHCGDGEDNDGDGLIDCADPDCDYSWFEGGCGDFEYSCQHISPYPECGGTCPVGEECIFYDVGDDDDGWCECMPVGETACGDSEYPSCGGWCLDEDICIPTYYEDDGCYCDFSFSFEGCYDTDGGEEPGIMGTVYYIGASYSDYCSDEIWVTEYWCTEGGIVSYGDFNCTEILGVNGVCEEDKFGNGYCVEVVF